jgi:hypothetical protein
MKLVQLFLPIRDNEGRKFKSALFSDVHSELVARFGGLTAYSRSPALGLWKSSRGPTKSDDIVVIEVMTASVDRAWWRHYRRTLQKAFRQEEIVLRVQDFATL